MAADGKENEIVAAKRVPSLIDVRGRVATGDAMFAQRKLSRRIRRNGGDYLRCVKEDRGRPHDDIAAPFALPPPPALPEDLLSATSAETAHGRYEERRLTASGALVGHSDRPAAAQVSRLERRTLRGDGGRQESVAYGVTSLPRRVADADRLLALARGHWGIENGLSYRRDVTLGEDRSLLRRGNGPQVLATLNDLTGKCCSGKDTRTRRRDGASTSHSPIMHSTYLPLADFATAL